MSQYLWLIKQAFVLSLLRLNGLDVEATWIFFERFLTEAMVMTVINADDANANTPNIPLGPFDRENGVRLQDHGCEGNSSCNKSIIGRFQRKKVLKCKLRFGRYEELWILFPTFVV